MSTNTMDKIRDYISLSSISGYWYSFAPKQKKKVRFNEITEMRIYERVEAVEALDSQSIPNELAQCVVDIHTLSKIVNANDFISEDNLEKLTQIGKIQIICYEFNAQTAHLIDIMHRSEERYNAAQAHGDAEKHVTSARNAWTSFKSQYKHMLSSSTASTASNGVWECKRSMWENVEIKVKLMISSVARARAMCLLIAQS